VDLVQHEVSVLGVRVCMLAVSAALGPGDEDGVLQKSFLRSFIPHIARRLLRVPHVLMSNKITLHLQNLWALLCQSNQ